MTPGEVVDSSVLAARLREALTGEVHFDAGSRALYSADASNYRQVPIGVVIPRTVDDIVECVRVCRDSGAPILARGGGTSMCGQCVNVAVVIDASKYLSRVLEVRSEEHTSELQSHSDLVCRLLLEKKKKKNLL